MCFLLQYVIDYFNSRLDSMTVGQTGAAPEGQAEWSVDRVLELVQTFTQASIREAYDSVTIVSLSRHAISSHCVVTLSALLHVRSMPHAPG